MVELQLDVVRPLACLLLLQLSDGCDTSFGLDPVPDPLPYENLVRIHSSSRVIANDSQRNPQSMGEPAPLELYPVVLDDGSEPSVVSTSTGEYAFARSHATQAYRLRYTGADGALVHIVHDVSDVTVVDLNLGRPDLVAPPLGTTLEVIVNGAPTTGIVRLDSTGVWTSTNCSSRSNCITDWPTARSLSGPVGLLDAARFDRAVWVHVADVSGYDAIVAYRIEDVTMTAGGNTSRTFTYVAGTRDQCVRVRAARESEISREVAAGYGPISTFSANWSVSAVPTLDAPSGVGFNVAYSYGLTDEVDRDVMFMNPYTGHTLLLGMAVSSSRTIQVGAASPASIRNGTAHYALPSTSCATPTTITAPTALPHTITLGSTPLASDDTTVAVGGAASLRLGWQVTGDQVDHFQVSLFRLVEAAGETTLQSVARWYTLASEVAVDPAMFEPGHVYVIRVVGRLGFPDSKFGDFTRISYPYGLAHVFSSTFSVTE